MCFATDEGKTNKNDSRGVLDRASQRTINTSPKLKKPQSDTNSGRKRLNAQSEMGFSKLKEAKDYFEVLSATYGSEECLALSEKGKHVFMKQIYFLLINADQMNISACIKAALCSLG